MRCDRLAGASGLPVFGRWLWSGHGDGPTTGRVGSVWVPRVGRLGASGGERGAYSVVESFGDLHCQTPALVEA